MPDDFRQRVALALEVLQRNPDYDWLTRSSRPVFRASEVAEILSLDIKTVNSWCTDGLIEEAANFDRAGWRLPRSSLLVFLAQRITFNQPGEERK